MSKIQMTAVALVLCCLGVFAVTTLNGDARTSRIPPNETVHEREIREWLESNEGSAMGQRSWNADDLGLIAGQIRIELTEVAAKFGMTSTD